MIKLNSIAKFPGPKEDYIPFTRTDLERLDAISKMIEGLAEITGHDHERMISRASVHALLEPLRKEATGLWNELADIASDRNVHQIRG